MNRKPDGKGFLSRWSRLKQGALSPDEVEQSKPNIAWPDKQVPDQAQPDLIDESSQLAAEQLKKRALRSLFRQAEFNQLDGLNDYDEDFTSFSELGNLITEQMQRMMQLAEKQKNHESGCSEPGSGSETIAASEAIPDETQETLKHTKDDSSQSA